MLADIFIVFYMFQSLEVILSALTETYPRTGHRYSLYLRAHKICHAPRYKKIHHYWEKFTSDEMHKISEPVKVRLL